MEVVQQRTTEIQSAIEEGGYEADEVINPDETGVLYGAPPKLQYIPVTANRAMAPASDDKARFTSLLAGDTSGKMLPSFNIVKMNVKGVNLSSSRVLDNLMKVSGLRVEDGWEKQVWRRTLTLPHKGKKELVTAEHVRPYLIHTDGTIITVQAKAWMDSAGICMWAYVLLGPMYRRKRGKALVVWDNCGSHNVDAVKTVLSEWGITADN